jgi:hypothetical protein
MAALECRPVLTFDSKKGRLGNKMHCQACVFCRSFLECSNKRQGCQATSSAMLSLFSLSSRVFQANIWTRPVQSLWSCSRTVSSISQDTKSTSQDTKPDQVSAPPRSTKDDPNLRHKWRYRNEDEYRKRTKDVKTNYRRSPLGREKTNAAHREYGQRPERRQSKVEVRARLQRESLAYRRATALALSMHTGRWIKEAWTWKLHTPVVTPDRVDRHCTGCHQDRFLKLWWATKAEPTTYICNSCFASDFDIMVPEGQHKPLPPVFTSPHLPLPPPEKPSS